MSDSPLHLFVPPALRETALRAGFTLTAEPPTTAPTPEAVLRAWSLGMPAICAPSTHAALLALRPLALFATTFSTVLTTGTFRQSLPATEGLLASERSIREIGSVVFVHNPTEKTVTGSVFPALPEVTLSPAQTLCWVHDAVIGEASRYLAAYAGLVKSDANVLLAQIRPDPFMGARVFVTGEPGTTREVVLFGSGRGESLRITFTDEPAVYEVAESQVVAVPEWLASRVWPGADNAPTWLGADDVFGDEDGSVLAGALPLWRLDPDGTLTLEPVAYQETDDLTLPGWYLATIGGDDEPLTAQLTFAGETPEGIWLNHRPVMGTDITLQPGENHLVVRHEPATPQSFGPVTLTPDGACFLLDITRWSYRSFSSIRRSGTSQIIATTI